MSLFVSLTDARNIEVLASGLPNRGGAQVAVDVTFRSALDMLGTARFGASGDSSMIATAARADKEI